MKVVVLILWQSTIWIGSVAVEAVIVVAAAYIDVAVDADLIDVG